MMNTVDAPHETCQVISEMVRLVKEWDPYFFEKVGLAPIPDEDVQEGAVPRVRAAAPTVSRRSATHGWRDDGRACGSPLPMPRPLSPNRCGRCSGSPRRRWRTTRGSRGAAIWAASTR